MILPFVTINEETTKLSIIWSAFVLIWLILNIVFLIREATKMTIKECFAFGLITAYIFLNGGNLGGSAMLGIMILYNLHFHPQKDKNEKTEYEYDIPGKHYNEPKNED